MKFVPPYLILLSLLLLSSCQLKQRQVLVIRMNGELVQVYNPNEIDCYKGDTVVVESHCGYNNNSCDLFLCNIYRGKCPADSHLDFGDHIESSTYEKAIFLNEIDKTPNP